MPSLRDSSPYGQYLEHLKAGDLAYQVTPDGQAVFFPRVAAPGSGAPLAWRVSRGLGTVYAVTVLYPRGEDPYDVAMIDMDEGYRLMSAVRGIDPHAVRIGLRVKAVIEQAADGTPYPVFHPLGEAAP